MTTADKRVTRQEIIDFTNNRRSGNLKVGVVGNCQGNIIADYIRHANTNYNVSSLVSGNSQNPLKQEQVVDFCKTQDIIIMTSNLLKMSREIDHPRIIMVPYTTFFPCFHPDLVSIADHQGKWMISPANVFHSKIIVEAFLRGYDARMTQKLFNAGTFEKIGYFDLLDTTLARLRQNFSVCGLDLDLFLAKFFRGDNFLYVGPHPTPVFVADVTRAVLENNNIALEHTNVDLHLTNKILESSIWPVYPEIASRYGLDKWGSYLFSHLGICYNLPQFIEASFFVYQHTDMANTNFVRLNF